LDDTIVFHRREAVVSLWIEALAAQPCNRAYLGTSDTFASRAVCPAADGWPVMRDTSLARQFFSSVGRAAGVFFAKVAASHTSKLPVYVINLARRPDRKEAMARQLALCGFTNVTFLEATDGAKLQVTDEVRELFAGNDFGSRRGVVGCALSHYYFWERFALGREDLCLVLEDDVTLPTNLAALLRANEGELARRDMVLLGYHRWAARDDEKNDGANDPSGCAIVPLDKNSYMGASFSYTITREGARKAYSWCTENGIKHGIDMIYAFQVPMDCFETRPHLVHSQMADSNIQFSQDALDIPSVSVQSVVDSFRRVPNVRIDAAPAYFVPRSLHLMLTRAHLDKRCVAVDSRGGVYYASGFLVPAGPG